MAEVARLDDYRKLKMEVILDSVNIAEELDDDELGKIGAMVVTEFESDEESRSEWLQRMDAAFDLALQVTETKNYPWRNASNVKFPLLTIASMQFLARTYPALMQESQVVKCKTMGKDPNGEKKARADRIGRHMSYQVSEEDEDWEEAHDRLLMALPITGTEFSKTYHDPRTGITCSKWVMSKYLTMPYRSTSVEAAPRKTEQLFMHPRQIREMQLAGVYSDVDLPTPATTQDDGRKNERTVMTEGQADADAPRCLLEQHRFLDLDHDDYSEPYIVTVDRDTKQVLRIYRRFEETDIETDADDAIRALAKNGSAKMQELAQQGQAEAATEMGQLIEEQVEVMRAKATITRIEPTEYYTKFSFVPSPDGGIYDLGFGALLGPLNKSVNTIINQLIDSGHRQVSNCGFLGRGARIPSDKLMFEPYEWKRINASGADLKNNIVPLPVNPPSNVLYQLLSLLIDYGQRVASVSEMMQGQTPGQNTPATTSMSAFEEGLSVFRGIHKRVYRGFTREFRKRYLLNRIFLKPERYMDLMDGNPELLQGDYWSTDPKDISPTADPTMITDQHRTARAGFLASRASAVPGYNPMAVEKRLLESQGIPDTEEVYPTEEGKQIPAPPNPEIELEKLVEQRRTMESQDRAKVNEAEIQIKGDKAVSEMALNELKGIVMMAELEQGAEALDIERAGKLIELMKAKTEGSKDGPKKTGSDK